MNRPDTDYHRGLPYGERVDTAAVEGGDFLPFDGSLTAVSLDEPVVPEPPRAGEDGGNPCLYCENPDGHVIWRGEHWHVRSGFGDIGLPLVAGLVPNEHMSAHTMPDDVAADLGPTIMRLVRAVETLPEVGRCHFSRWGDGSQHFHMWFLARPLGMMQMRGAMLAVWDDLLPRVPDELRWSNIRLVAEEMASGGGELGPALR